MQLEKTQLEQRTELGSSHNQSAFKRVKLQQEKSIQIQNSARPTIWKDYINDIVQQRKSLFKRLKHQKEQQNIKKQISTENNKRRVEKSVIIIPPHNSNFFSNEKFKKIRRNEKVKEVHVNKEKGSYCSGNPTVESSSELTQSPSPIRKRIRKRNRPHSALSTDYRTRKSTSSCKKRKLSKKNRMSRYGPRGKYKMYTDEERETIFRYAEEYGPKQAVKMFGIDRRRIKRWMEKGSCRNIGGQGRSPLNVEMEQKLVKEIEVYCYREGKYPKRKLIKEWALLFYTGEGEFKASKGWFDKFFRRNKGVLQELKDNY